MRILQLCLRIPYPPKDGGALAVNNLTLGYLNAGHNVRVLALNTKKHHVDLSSLPEWYMEKTRIRAVTVNTDINPFTAFLYLFGNGSYNIARFESSGFEQLLKEVLAQEEFDIVQLESLFMVPYLPVIRQLSDARVILRSHNVEFEIWKRKAHNATDPLKKLYLKHLARRLEDYEIRHLNAYDAIVPISASDEREFVSKGCRIPLFTAPFGIDLKNYPLREPESPPTLFFIGSLDWDPNLEGLHWFLENCWPVIHQKVPWLKFRVAGRNMDRKLLNLRAANVEIIGEVDSSLDFIGKNSVMVVPLFSGSGMRIKIIEGMAMGKTIISTSLGAEGIECTHGENILIADSSEEFCTLVEESVTKAETGLRLGSNGRKLVEEKYDNGLITANLLRFYQNLLNSENTGTSFQGSLSA
jgi:polysaccharide biosynthesis protein PslH